MMFFVKVRNQKELKMGCGHKGSISNSFLEELGRNRYNKSSVIGENLLNRKLTEGGL